MQIVSTAKKKIYMINLLSAEFAQKVWVRLTYNTLFYDKMKQMFERKDIYFTLSMLVKISADSNNFFFFLLTRK